MSFFTGDYTYGLCSPGACRHCKKLKVCGSIRQLASCAHVLSFSIFILENASCRPLFPFPLLLGSIPTVEYQLEDAV